MDYFDKQDSNKAAQQQENYNRNQPPEQPGYHIQSKNVFPDNWKVPQDGDFDFVSVLAVVFKQFLFSLFVHCWPLLPSMFDYSLINLPICPSILPSILSVDVLPRLYLITF